MGTEDQRRDRIKRLKIGGLRSLDEVTLELEGLTVLIGENGSGKSSVLEALELLRRSAEGDLVLQLNQLHSGLHALLRQGAPQLELRLTLEGPAGTLEYELALGYEGNAPRVVWELLQTVLNVGAHRPIIRRDGTGALVVDDEVPEKLSAIDVHPGETVVSAMGAVRLPSEIKRLKEALRSIDVHLPFDVGAAWGHKTLRRSSTVREPNQLNEARRLERHGANLSNVWHSLQNDFSREHWRETLEYVRLGLGDDVETVVVSARLGATPGHASLGVKYRSFEQPISAIALSDGTLSYLCFVALARMTDGRSLLAFDEPEDHLHPALLARVIGLLEETSAQHPVIIATHSDRLLDGLSDPAASVVLCELDEERATRFKSPDREELESWLKEYGGYGSLRAAGLEPIVTTNERPR